MDYQDDIYLYRSDGSALDLADLPDWLAQRERPVLLHVHGRGREPNKSLHDKQTVQQLERDFGVDCLLFSWDSHPNGVFGPARWLNRSVPLANAPRGAQKLAAVLQVLASMDTPPRLPALLVHSMGNVVLQQVLQQQAWPMARRLFSNILLTEPDCDAQGHAAWLQMLAEQQPVYLAFNRFDQILLRARNARTPLQTPLGLGPAGENAAAVHYLDLSGLLGKTHTVFLKAKMHTQLSWLNVVQGIVSGQPDPIGEPDLASKNGNLYQLSNQPAPGHPAFADPGTRIDDDD
jgi:hypothetical protein